MARQNAPTILRKKKKVTNKPWYKRWQFWIGVLVVGAVIEACSGGGEGATIGLDRAEVANISGNMMILINKRIAILGIIGLLLSACDDGGGDSNNSNNGGTFVTGGGNTVGDSNTGEIIVTGDGNTVIVETIGESDFNENTPTENGLFGNSQNDCRRPDVLRLGFQDFGASLILFPNSVSLPSQSGSGIRRMIQIPDGNPAFFDSLVLSEIGTVSVTHISEGPENTVMELFDLSPENEIRVFAGSGEFDEFNGRAGVDIALQPGVYCFYIADAAGAFTNNTGLTVDYTFTPP